MRIALMTNAHASDRDAALERLLAQAGDRAVFEVTPEERDRFGAVGDRLADPGDAPPDLCLALGGDGTILRGLRAYADTDVPVFAVNFGTIGFLATTERDDLDEALSCALERRFTTMLLPAVQLVADDTALVALNDVTFARRAGDPVAELSYVLADEEVGRVRCDGLVAATPAGSTGYNLANGGPVMAWGVSGYAVSFVAPHTLTARALVAAPDDVLKVRNLSDREPVAISLDGEYLRDLDCGGSVEVSFREGVSRLAQLPGANFYHRVRERFGRLAQ